MGRKSSSKRAEHDAGPPPESTGPLRVPVALAFAIAVVLALATLGLFAKTGSFDFINFDDPVYVTENAHTKTGLTRENLAWAFTTGEASNWHPLTWLSLMLDVELFGVSPGPHHLVNAAFHAANTALLFGLLVAGTGAYGASLVVALLFGIHPLHVESVAWISERKDVLSTFFWLLATAAWVAHVRRPRPARSILAFVLFAFGLMAKPMLVTFPATLLLLDLWPLRRVDPEELRRGPASPVVRRLLVEKIPFFLLSVASSIVTWSAQQAGAAMTTLDVLPVPLRLANAAVSYLRYVEKLFVPTDLAVFYPHPGESIAPALVAISVVFLAGMTLGALAALRRHPFFAVGWFWYLGTLFPVIGIVQVGAQAMADRYTYVPFIGLFVALAWGLDAAAGSLRVPRAARYALAAAPLLLLARTTSLQLEHWRSSLTLFEHTVAVTRDNALARKNLATALTEAGRHEEAAAHTREAIRLDPNDPSLHYNLGNALVTLGRTEEAITELRRALGLPGEARVRRLASYNLANTLARSGRLEESLPHYDAALAVDPNDIGSIVNKGNVLALLRRPAEAALLYRRAIDLDPGNSDPWTNLGNAQAELGRLAEAESSYRKAVELEPNQVNAHRNLASVLEKLGRKSEAAREAELARELEKTSASP